MKRIMFYGLLGLALGALGMGNSVKGENISCKLEVETLIDRCKFTLIVKNNLNSENVLQFPTSQQYDFIVKSSDGKIIWQWSKGMMFAQAFTSLILSSNEEKTFTEEYSLPIGEYSAQGILTSTPDKIYADWVSFNIQALQMPALKGRITKILDKLYFLGRDGTAYLIENPSEEIEGLQDKTIEVTSYQSEPIPGTIDKKITIEEYREEDIDAGH